MAQRKRRTGGRVTPKGTKPGGLGLHKTHHLDHADVKSMHGTSTPDDSTRYTPPTPKTYYQSPQWVPILMFVFLGLGVVSILLRYVVPAFENTNTPVMVGLGFMLAGLFTATKWR